MPFMKILIFVSLLVTLFGCGNGYVDSGKVVPRDKFPLTYKVNRAKYERYKLSFDRVEQQYKSKSGIDLVKFVPADENPKFTDSKDSLNLPDNWVLFKENASEFQNIGGNTVGLYTGWVELGRGNLIVNIYKHASTYNRVKKVLYHEVGHALGFDHTHGLDYSTMNYNFNLLLPFLSRYDRRRLHDKYPFSTHELTQKDLELVGADEEGEQLGLIKKIVHEKFGLSAERVEEIAPILHNLNKIKNKRNSGIR